MEPRRIPAADDVARLSPVMRPYLRREGCAAERKFAGDRAGGSLSSA